MAQVEGSGTEAMGGGPLGPRQQHDLSDRVRYRWSRRCVVMENGVYGAQISLVWASASVGPWWTEPTSRHHVCMCGVGD